MVKYTIYNSYDDDHILTKFESNPQYERIKKIINDIDSIDYKYDKIQTPHKGPDMILHQTQEHLISKAHTARNVKKSIIQRGGVPRASTIRRHQTLGTCGTVSDLDRVSSNSRYNFFVEIWCFLLKVSGTSDRNLCNKPIRMDTNRFNYTFSFNGFIIILRVNTKPSADGCSQTAYSIIINISPHDIHFTLFYNIYRDSRGNRCWPDRHDESSALHITVINRTAGKYRLYIPWEYVSNSDKDARELLISSIYKISYYLLAKKTCNGIDITQLDSRTLNYDNLITSISSLPSAVGYPVRTDVAGKMKQLAIDLAGELNGFYRSCASPRTFDISNQCPPHTGGNKKISKKLEKYLLKQKEYINKLKLLRKNKLKNKVKIIKQNNLLKNLKIKIKKEKAMAKEKLKKQKAKAKEKLKKQKTKKVHITKKIKK